MDLNSEIERIDADSTLDREGRIEAMTLAVSAFLKTKEPMLAIRRAVRIACPDAELSSED